jgi:hypothetical protein
VHRFWNIDDQEAERLFAGQEPEDGRLDGVARFLTELDRACPEAFTDSLEPSHVAAMVQTSKLLAKNGATAEPQEGDAQGSFARTPAPPKWRSTGVGRNLVAHRWAAVAVFSLAALLTFGGAAYAGILPASIENAVAGAAQYVGISFPGQLVRGHSDFGRAHKLGTADSGEGARKGVIPRALEHAGATSTAAVHSGIGTSPGNSAGVGAGTGNRGGVSTGGDGVRAGIGKRAHPPAVTAHKARPKRVPKARAKHAPKAHANRAQALPNKKAHKRAAKKTHPARGPRTEHERSRR